MSKALTPLLLRFTLLCGSDSTASQTFSSFRKQFIEGYTALRIPDMEYDYHDYFNNIPSLEQVQHQQHFFKQQRDLLRQQETGGLSAAERLDLAQIIYETEYNSTRLQLEENWIHAGRLILEGGLFTLPNHKQWYALFIQKFTSTRLSPEQVFELGASELRRVKKEIARIQHELGFQDSIAFYRHLETPSFFITNKQELIDSFDRIDKRMRLHLGNFVSTDNIPEVYAMEWPGANANTPPGAYLNRSSNAYGKDVFQFNFFGGRYNKRVMEWLYMHEAIPGHHLQFSIRSASPPDALQTLFIYPGNFEGWACYVEYTGKELGMYADPYSELGKWEWDLVRSVRLVLDAGIHYYGWTRAQALQYWKQHVPGQDAIAEREVSRVTKWCAQALSYKVGAHAILGMKQAWQQRYPQRDLKNFHDAYLKAGMRPILVLQNQLFS